MKVLKQNVRQTVKEILETKTTMKTHKNP